MTCCLPEYIVSLHESVVSQGESSDFYPIRRAEVDGLCQVESGVEAGVVSARESDHELSGTLHGTVQLHPVFLQNRRRDRGRDMMHQVAVLVIEFRGFRLPEVENRGVGYLE